MKKITSLVLSIVLVLTLSLSMIGCNEPESSNTLNEPESSNTLSEPEKFIGSWEASIDCAELFNNLFSADEEMGEYIEIEEFELILKVTFKDDGTYKMSVDPKSVEKAVDSLKKDLKKGFTKYFQAVIDSEGLNMTVEELLVANGTNLDDLLEEAFGEDDVDAFVSELESEGKFEVKDGKLYMSDDLDSDIDEDEYETYEISENELKLTDSFGEDVEDGKDFIYPITFKKVS